MNSPQPFLVNKIKALPFSTPTNPVYSMQAPDSSMERFHIPLNAMLTVDRSIIPDHKNFVVVEINGQKIIRRLVKAPRTWVLESGNDKPLVIKKEMITFFGVVTKIIIE